LFGSSLMDITVHVFVYCSGGIYDIVLKLAYPVKLSLALYRHNIFFFQMPALSDTASVRKWHTRSCRHVTKCEYHLRAASGNSEIALPVSRPFEVTRPRYLTLWDENTVNPSFSFFLLPLEIRRSPFLCHNHLESWDHVIWHCEMKIQ